MFNPFPTPPVTLENSTGIPLPSDDDDLVEIRISRRFVLCVALSLLLHAILFVMPMRAPLENSSVAGQTVQGPLTVRLANPNATPPAIEGTAPVEPAPEPPHPQKEQIALTKNPSQRNIATTPKQTREHVAAPAPDMASMLNAARERRSRTGEAPRETDGTAGDTEEATTKDLAAANITNDIKRRTSRRDGTNGVFQILSKGTRTGRFSFRGWQNRSQNNWRETIDVDAGPNGNVELAIVRKMIELIRKHYSGDFSWESHRLGRVLILSARPQDSAELEAFLMKEFFEG